MKAVFWTNYGAPEVLKLGEAKKPTPKKNEVCIKMYASAVTASDSRTRAFRFPLWHPMIFMFRLIIGVTKPRKPILGMILAGEIESVGKEVTRFKPGDQVYGMTGASFGAYAEYTCISEKACLVKKPANVSFEEAAAVTYGALLGNYCLQRGNIQSGQKVLIYGASGAIGTAAVQLAKHYGAEVTGVCSTRNLELVQSLGADAVLDYTKDDLISRGETYDLILDAVGKDKSSPLKLQCKDALSKNGKYQSVDDGMLKSAAESLDLVNTLMVSGRFQVVIDKAYPLEQIVEAHRHVDSGHKRGNVVITIAHKD